MNRGSACISRSLRDATLLASLMLAVVTPALARTAKVPEDFSTIQAAVDHLVQFYAADTVLVQAGHYPERVFIQEAVCLMSVAAPGSAVSQAKIDGLTVQPPSDGSTIRVVGIHITGPAVTRSSNGPDNVHYESCRFDAGMQGPSWYPDVASIVMRRCTLSGRIALCARVAVIVDSCTVYGPLVLLADGAAVVTNNRFEDVPGTAVTLFSDQRAYVARNVVRGGSGGLHIRTGTQDELRVEDNWIEGCTGTGLRAESSPWSYRSVIERNHVSRCGGAGIDASGLIRAVDNRVFGCGSHGINLIQTEEIGLVEGNVVGRCGGDGIRLRLDFAQDPTGFHTQGNTVYACAGSGIVALGLTAGSVSNNIAFRNRGFGLLTTGSDAAPVSCNDWFENLAGATSALKGSARDLAVDPLFCDLANDDVHLRSDSPLLQAPGCGLIGALGQGCEPPVEIEFRFTPSTFHVASHGRWVTGELEPPAPFSADAIDLASIRLNGVPVDQAAPIGPGERGRSAHRTLTVRFDRDAVSRTLTHGEAVPVVVTGTIGARSFRGTDVIRVLRGTGGIAVDISHETSAAENPPALSVRASSLHPTAGGRLSVEFTLPDQSPARLDLLDVAGRVMMSQQVGDLGPGRHTLDLSPSRAVPRGMYFVRLRQGATEARSRAAVIR